MELFIGNDTLRPVYYAHEKVWVISKNNKETLRDKSGVWIKFDTEKEVEEYLEKIANYYQYAWLSP